MITDGLITAFQSKRLVYRAIRDNEDDRRFLLEQIDNDPVNTALASRSVIRPKGLISVVGELVKSTLAVMVCLPDASATEEGNDSKKNAAPTPIGFLALGWGGQPVDQTHHRSTGVSISLAAPYQGQGYGAEAINWALDWAFRFGGYHRVSIGTVSYNERAQHLYKKLGFVEEGRSREMHWFDRKWYDGVNFGMLENEWAVLRGISTE
jgi:GNAT superfamily N-acetyltransferase